METKNKNTCIFLFLSAGGWKHNRQGECFFFFLPTEIMLSAPPFLCMFSKPVISVAFSTERRVSEKDEGRGKNVVFIFLYFSRCWQNKKKLVPKYFSVDSCMVRFFKILF